MELELCTTVKASHARAPNLIFHRCIVSQTRAKLSYVLKGIRAWIVYLYDLRHFVEIEL